MGTFRGVKLRRITAEDTSNIGCSITGLPGHPIEGVVLEDIRLEFEGGGTADLVHREIPERPEAYPESTMFGVLPAYGLYCRHVKGVVFRNVELRVAKRDERPAILCDDVAELLIDGLDVDAGVGAPIRFVDVVRAEMRRFAGPESMETLLRVEGGKSKGIVLIGEKPGGLDPLVDTAPDVPRDAVAVR